MNKLDIFNTIVDKVCEVTVIRRETLMGGVKLRPVVEARVLACQYLWRAGFSSDEIALFVIREQMGDPLACPDISVVKSKAKGIDKSICTYTYYCKESYAFSIMSSEISKFCKEKYGEMYVYGMKELK